MIDAKTGECGMLNHLNFKVSLGAKIMFFAGNCKKPIFYTAKFHRIELLLSEVRGMDITDLIASGREKLA